MNIVLFTNRNRPAKSLYRLIITLAASLWITAAAAQSFTVGVFRPWSGYAIPNGNWLVGDFNGDGRSDILHAVQNTDYAHIWTSTGNGAFTVSTFSPWSGYAIPNGNWLVGDFNGDGRSDILHAVQNTDYAHVWTSTGNGTFNVSTFSPWRGYAIPNGIWLVGDFNGDGRSDILHAVQNTDYVHLWTSTGNGSFTVSTFRPWSGYAIPNGNWLVGDYNGDGRADILHAVQNTDYVHVWTSNGNGTFNVSTFSPWSGYGIPNGNWLVGDYNGDGRSDILHAVQNTDYAHVWTSNGNGTFNVSTFSPWSGYGIPNGLWIAGDYNGDGRTDILHAVANTDYVHIWSSNGNGSFAVSTFSPWSGYAIPNGLWLLSDFNDDGKSDIIHAVQGADYVHPWTSTPPAPSLSAGQVGLEGLEVTQSIQDMGHNVALVAEKQTYVRAYLAISSAAAVNISGVLTVRNPATGQSISINSTGNATVDPTQNGNLRTKRESFTASLNFILPQQFTTAGMRSVALASISRAGTNTPVVCSNCAGYNHTAKFINSPHLRVKLVGLSYTTGAPPNQVVNAPRATDFNLALSWLKRAYPVAQVLSTQTTVASNTAWPFGCGNANAQLATLRAIEVAGGTDGRTHYYGLVSDAGGFMRGCASGVPNAPDPTVVASGPAGSNWAGDTDGSYADWYGGHELGHTFGRLHPGFCGETADDITVFPFPNGGRISHTDGNEAGMDVGDAGNAIPTVALATNTTFDVMTYCPQPEWTSAYTYQGIRSRLILEAPAFNANPGVGTRGAPFPLLTAANLARVEEPVKLDAQPAFFKLAIAQNETKPVPATMAQQPKKITGASKEPNKIVGSTVAPQVITGQNQASALTQLTQQAPALSSAPPITQGMPSKDIRSQPKEFQTQTRTLTLKQGAYLSVVATVNLTKNTGKIEFLTSVPQGMVSSEEQNDRAVLKFYDRGGKAIAQHLVWLREDTDIPEKEDRTALIDAVVPFLPNASALELIVDGKVLDRRQASQTIPSFNKIEITKLPANKTQQLQIQPLETGTATLHWNASDADGDNLTYRVEVSVDNKKTWQVLAVGLKQNELALSEQKLKELGPKRVFRVIADDGWHSSKPITIPY